MSRISRIREEENIIQRQSGLRGGDIHKGGGENRTDGQGGEGRVYDTVVIIRTCSKGHQTLVKKLVYFDLPSTAWPSGAHFPGGNHCRIDLKTK